MNREYPAHIQELTIDDFEIVKPLGKGAYSEVALVKNKLTGHESALKIIDKSFVIKEKKLHHVYIEKEVLSLLRHKGIIKLFNSFEDKEKVFFSLEMLNDGNLLEYMDKHTLNDSIIKFYTAELLLILEYLHQNGLVHRDVKPENILLTKDKHIKLIDFGTIFAYDTTKISIGERIEEIRSKYSKQRSPSLNNFEKPPIKYCKDSSFVGTSEYLCPELVDYNIIGPQADLWALGCFMYQLYTHQTPFFSENEFQLFHNISQVEWVEDSRIPSDALDLIKILLDRNPEIRFNGEIDESNYNYDFLKSHKYFKDINFKHMWLQDAPVPVVLSQKRKMSRYQTTMLDNIKQKEKEGNRGNSAVRFEADQIILKGNVDKEHGVLFMTQFSIRYATILIQGGIPYLNYINPQLNNKKTSIPLNQFTTCKMIGKGKFIIGDKNKKKYIFKQREHDISAQQWVHTINKYINSNPF